MTSIATSGTDLRAPGLPRDLRTINRRSLALMAPVAPLLIACLRLVMPYNTSDSTAQIVAKAAAHPGRQSLVVALGTVAVLVVIPGYLAVGRLCRRQAPVLTTAGLALAVIGYVGLALVLSYDALLVSVSKVGLDVPTATRLVDHMNGQLVFAVGGAVFVAGHVLGTILLGVALLRSRAIASWAAVAVLISQPIHAFSAVVITSHPLDFVGWSLLAAGFAAAGWRLWRQPDDDWELAPVARTS